MAAPLGFSPSDIETVWIDPDVVGFPRTREIMDLFPPEKLNIGSPRFQTGRMFRHISLKEIKKRLFVTHYKGRLVKPCPGSRGRICCGYWVINAMVHCPMDCHYCVLQDYLSVPALTIFVDENRIKQEVLVRLNRRPDHIFRFGTGELADSLVHNTFTRFSERMIPFFAKTRNGILEFKTKTDAISLFEGLDPKGHTVVSWSVNPEYLIQKIEPRTSPLSRRIRAARRCQEMGYWIGFHFDPLVWFDGWEKAYLGVIEEIARLIDPNRVIWISIAGLRFTRLQKENIRKRFPNTPLFLGEFFREEDGKYRYLQVLRASMYRKIIHWLREWSPNLFIYFCMESKRIWEKTFPAPPKNTRELDERFSKNVWRHLKES